MASTEESRLNIFNHRESAAWAPKPRELPVTLVTGFLGAGKTTLFSILLDQSEADEGKIEWERGTQTGYLPQESAPTGEETVLELASSVTPELKAVQETLRTHPEADDPTRLEALERFAELEGYTLEAKAKKVLSGLAFQQEDFEKPARTLSGGWIMRAHLARLLVMEPDLLMLDEPTNHLDLPTIEWLERELVDRRKTLITISHDRAFLEAMTTDTFWLHRGTLRHNASGYAAFEDWTEQVANAEVRAAQKLNQKLKAEARWLERGVTARRRRNQGRLARLETMRAQRKALLTGQDLVQLEADAGPIGSRLVVECEGLCKSFGDDVIIDKFSTRILRGDRVGLVGPNGAGKTTLLKLLIGELEKDSGRLRLAKNMSLAFFDQAREQLDPNDTLWQALAPRGGDSINVRGRQRHVVAYLRDFLFDDKQARAPIATLSGGERNRLLLAKILAQQSNLLVLDEPTNDLDADTLDVLLEMLDSYEGTVLLVSHGGPVSNLYAELAGRRSPPCGYCALYCFEMKCLRVYARHGIY